MPPSIWQIMYRKAIRKIKSGEHRISMSDYYESMYRKETREIKSAEHRISVSSYYESGCCESEIVSCKYDIDPR